MMASMIVWYVMARYRSVRWVKVLGGARHTDVEQVLDQAELRVPLLERLQQLLCHLILRGRMHCSFYHCAASKRHYV